MLKTMVRRPTALGLIDFGMSEQGPGIKAALVCQVASEGETFLRDFHTLLQEAGLPPGVAFTLAEKQMYQLPLPVPGGLFYGVVDEHFILAVGVQGAEAIIKQVSAPTSSLATNAQLVACEKKIGGAPQTRAAALFVNTTELLARLRELLPMFTGGDPRQDGTGLEGPLRAGPGSDRLDQLGATPPRGRLLSRVLPAFCGRADGHPLLPCSKSRSPRPISRESRRTPSWAAAFNADIAAAWPRVLDLIASLDPEAAAEIKENISETEAELGFRLVEDLFTPLGDTFVFFDAPENGGVLFSGITAIVEASDPARLQATFRKIVKLIAEEVEEDEVKLAVSSFDYRSHRIEFVNLTGVPMFVAPAWANHEGRIIMGLYPQMVQATLDRILDDKTGADALSANPDFIKGCKVPGRARQHHGLRG